MSKEQDNTHAQSPELNVLTPQELEAERAKELEATRAKASQEAEAQEAEAAKAKEAEAPAAKAKEAKPAKPAKSQEAKLAKAKEAEAAKAKEAEAAKAIKFQEAQTEEERRATRTRVVPPPRKVDSFLDNVDQVGTHKEKTAADVVGDKPKPLHSTNSGSRSSGSSFLVRALNSSAKVAVAVIKGVGNIGGGLLTFAIRTVLNVVTFIPDLFIQQGRKDTRAEFNESTGFLNKGWAFVKAPFKSIWQSIKSFGVQEAGAANAAFRIVKGENLEDKNDISNSKVNVISLKNLLGATTSVSRMVTDKSEPNEPTAKVAYAFCKWASTPSKSK